MSKHINLNMFNTPEMKAHRAKVEKEIQEYNKQQAEDRRMWSAYCNNFKYAEGLYKKGETEKAISAYEQTVQEMLKYGTRRLNLQACFDLVKLYSNENRMNDAWRLTNQMYLNLVPYDETLQFAYKIRYEQFRILRKEKRYIDALSALIGSWFLKGWSYGAETCNLDPAYMQREARTTIKGAGISSDDLQELLDQVIHLAKRGSKNERDVRGIYDTFLRNKGLVQR